MTIDDSPLPRPSLIRTAWMTMLLAILFAACDLVRLGSDYTQLMPTTVRVRYAGIALSIAFILMMKRGAYGRGVAFSDLSWMLCGGAILFSACVQADPESAAVGLWTMAVVPLLFGRMIPCALGRKGVLILALAILGAGLPYLLSSLLLHPLTFPYMGVLPNPNSMGVLAGGMDVALIALLVAAGKNKKRLFALVLTVAVVFTSLLVVASGSRTSCLAVAVSAVVAIASRARALIGTPLRFIKTALALGVLIIIVRPMIEDSGAKAVAGILVKFETSSKLSERDEIWSKTWQDMSLLGNGRGYFDDEFGVGAHNSIVEMLGKYGLFAALGILLVCISSLYSTFCYYRSARGSDAHALTPFLIALSFWILASGETMAGPLGGAFNCLFLVSSGVANVLPGHRARCFLVDSAKESEGSLVAG